MYKLFAANGSRSLKIVFDINTHLSMEVYKSFIREVVSYLWYDIDFNKNTWTDVSEAERVIIIRDYKSSHGSNLLGVTEPSGMCADVDVNVFLQNPTFVTAIGDIIRSFTNQVNNDGEDANT
ncbi:unnamed protein product [Lactuca saligna]|uniref:Uncharacterized protein n=1 Tax=Lactuca saligna TaxID=75948 RepID=A0AA36EQ70_LACSI|nr:unnamed protein product [Lactuca saligna]